MLLFCVSLPIFATTILINGEKKEFTKIDVKESDVVFVPLRDLQSLGLGTINQRDDGTIEFNTQKMTLIFTKNSDSVRMNSLALKLPMSTYLDNGKLMVPLSFIAKSLNGEYEQAEELIVTINDLPMPTQKANKTVATPVVTPVETPKEETVAPAEEPAETPAESDKIITPYESPELSLNWFQGTVYSHSKKQTGVDIDLYDANNNLVQTTVSKDGAFAFKNIEDGTYFIKITNEKNPSFKTFKTDKFAIKDMQGSKIKKSFNLLRAIKSNGCKPNEVNGQKCYMFTWNAIPDVANYKVTVSSANKKAIVAKYDKKVEKINIPISDISKGNTYGVKVEAFDKNGNRIGESVGHGWTFESN